METRSPDQFVLCTGCGVTYHASQITKRGQVLLCTDCAGGLAADFARKSGSKSSMPLIILGAVACSVLLAGGWWVRSAILSQTSIKNDGGTATPTAVVAATPAPIASAPVVAKEEKPAEPKGAEKAVAEAAPKDAVPRPVVDAGSIHLLYVTRPGTDACMGLASRLFITKEAPDPISAKLMTTVGKDMETCFEEGRRYVEKQPRDWEKQFSIRLSFEDKFTPKDGGSAGTGFTVAMLAAIENVALDPELAVTGDVTVDGSVQPVGGVVEKLRGAIVEKCKVAMIPERNAHDVADMALLDGPSPLWEMQIFSIKTIEQALSVARVDRDEKTKAAIEKFNALRARLPAVVTPNYLRSPIVQSELKEVLQLAPNHLSAQNLLNAAENQLPKELSLNRSVDEIIAASYLFVQSVISPSEHKHSDSEEKGITTFPEREFGVCMKKLNNLTPILDRRSIELKSACISYASALRAASSYKVANTDGLRTREEWWELARRERSSQQLVKENYDDAHSKLLLALRKLDTDGSLMSELLKK